MFQSVKELVQMANQQKKPISQIMIDQEVAINGYSETDILQQMAVNLETMKKAVMKGTQGVASKTGITGFDGRKLAKYLQKGQFLTDRTFVESLCFAVATNEVNAAMGIICATPTAGSAGVIPGVLFSLTNKFHYSEAQQLRYLFCAAAFGLVVGNNAFLAGAEGGCQAEIGSAAAMAAAAAVEIHGGTPDQAATAFGLAMKNMIGLACDPVAGLVEIPCINRNAGGSSIALAGAEMALAGVKCVIPADEIIEVMYQVGRNMPREIRETGIGGLAGTKTALEIKEKIFGYDK